MTSVVSRYYQRDNRLETVILTGSLKNNGTIDSVNNVPPEQPAYAAIDLTKATNFYIDASLLRLRPLSDGTGIEYLIRIYVDSTKPPLYWQNFEWTIFIKLPPPEVAPTYADRWTAIEFFRTKAEAESVDNNYLFTVSNGSPDGNDVWPGTAAITIQVVNNEYILKSVSPQLYYG
jgi:hypothetical protein